MTINPTLFKAILSMDAYNRGYDAGISVAGENIGSATIGVDSTFALGRNGQGDFYDQSIGFYAIAYTYGDETIISFRGTDTFVLDPIHGWTLGTGNTSSQQGRMALEFYQAVAGSGNWLSANISLTGHSLGGGLAGYVGAL